ncbi:MAG TPA: PEP-utilizing enzyme [Candidatus Nanoarchaeia archaeon]|nr:PEP-utilizing enzyme [Candidatus Nanoarchaeia archaeon]
MADLTKLYQTQISLTEWFAQAGHANADALRKEDNDKRERLRILNRIVGLPFDEPRQFDALELEQQSLRFKEYLHKHGDELCALRLIPRDDKLPKLRMRGHSVRNVMIWFSEQRIDPAQYRAEFIPHAEISQWSTIFVVNKQGIFGEIVEGGHYQLTQGVHDKASPIAFSFDFNDWIFSSENKAAQTHLINVVSGLKTPLEKQQQLQSELNATFRNDYLCGYFETTSSQEFGLWFVDYNRILGKFYDDFTFKKSERNTDILQGQIGSPGKVQGRVRIIPLEHIGTTQLTSSEILVCRMTTPEYVPLMQQAAAIVTDQGGILSHAAIVARELGKPCIVGTKNATTVLKDGDLVEVDAGSVRLLKR